MHLNLMGGDRDERDCIGSAGYEWSSEKQQCVRPQEHKQTGECSRIAEAHNLIRECARKKYKECLVKNYPYKKLPTEI